MSEGRRNVLLCVCGSVAAVKAPQIATQVRGFAEVKVVLTKSAEHFWDKSAEAYNADAWKRFHSLEPPVEVYRDEREWESYARVGVDDVVHIEVRARRAGRRRAALTAVAPQLAKWADAIVFAPLSANSLAKLASGLCDNLAVRGPPPAALPPAR